MSTRSRPELLVTIAAKDAEILAINHNAHPICAYVTFQHEPGAIVACKVFQRATLNKCCTPDELRLRGKGGPVLDLKLAAEPSTIIWENLAYDACWLFLLLSRPVRV